MFAHSSHPSAKCSSGHWVLFLTWFRSVENAKETETAADAVCDAVEQDYRLIDGVLAYQNEKQAGEDIKRGVNEVPKVS